METKSSVVESTKYNQQVIELTADMEIPPERRGRIYDLTESLDHIVRDPSTAQHASFAFQDEQEGMQSMFDQPDVPNFPGSAAGDQGTVSSEHQEPPLDKGCEGPTEDSQPAIDSLPEGIEEYVSSDEQSATADLGVPLEKALEATAIDATGPCPAIELCDDDIESADNEKLGKIEDESPIFKEINGPSEIALTVDIEGQPEVTDSPEMAPEVQGPVSCGQPEPPSDPTSESLAEQAEPEPETLPTAPEEQASTAEQHLTAAIGIPLEETLKEEETVLERYIRTRYDTDLERMIDSVVARAVQSKLAALIPSIS